MFQTTQTKETRMKPFSKILWLILKALDISMPHFINPTVKYPFFHSISTTSLTGQSESHSKSTTSSRNTTELWKFKYRGLHQKSFSIQFVSHRTEIKQKKSLMVTSSCIQYTRVSYYGIKAYLCFGKYYNDFINI